MQLSEQNVKEEIKSRDTRYEELKNQKIKDETNNLNLFRNLENNQWKELQELRQYYENKLLIENEKYLNLEQVLIEERYKFQQNMKELEYDSQKQIKEIKSRFQLDLKQLYEAIVSNKNDTHQLLYSQQSIIQDDEWEEEYIKTLQQQFSLKIEDLQKEIKQKDKQLILYKSEKLNTKELDDLKQQMDKELNIQSEQEKFIKELQIQNKELQEKIDQNEQDLAHCYDQMKQYQKFISGLQKSKLVLSYKTHEMQSEMEPKDKKIKELIESIPKLGEEIQQLQNQVKNLEDKEKRIMNQMKVQTEEIEKLKQQLKKYQDLSKSIIMDLHNCYHEKKEKEWVDFIKYMYQKYVVKQQEKNESCKEEQDKKTENSIKLFTKDILQMVHEFREADWPQQLKQLYQKHFTGEMTTELCRQNQFLVKSSQENDKKFKKLLLWRDQEIYLKTQENMHLLTHLNQVIERKKSLETKLAKQLAQYESLLKSSQRGLSTQERRRSHHIENVIQQEDQLNLSVDLNNKKRGSLIKGQNYNKQNLIRFDQQRQSDLMTQMEIMQSRNQSLEQQLKLLKQKLIDAGIDEEQTQTNTQRPYSQKIKRS